MPSLLPKVRRTALSVFVLTVALAAAANQGGPLAAHTPQEQAIVATFAPSFISGYHYNGSAIVPDDLDPRSGETKVRASLDLGRALVATDRFVLDSNLFTSLPLAVVDRATGVEMPRPHSVVAGATAIAASPDGRFAYFIGTPLGTTTPHLAVLDLRTDSPTFDTEIAALPLLGNGTPVGVTVDPAGTRVIVSQTVNVPTPITLRLLTIDVANPAAPVLIQNTAATEPVAGLAPGFEITGTGRMTTFVSGGNTYLLVPRRQAQIYRVQANGALTYVQTLLVPQPQAVRDAVFVSAPDGDRVYAVVPRTATPFSLTVQAFNMTPAGLGFNGALAGTATLDTGGSQTSQDGNDIIGVTPDKTRLYVLRPSIPNNTMFVPTTLTAIDRVAVTASPATAVLATAQPNTVTNGTAPGLAVTSEFAPGPFAPSISGVAVDGVPNAVLVNDVPHTITVTGSNLGSIRQAMIGLTRATVTSASPASVTITTPALVPANTSPLVLLGNDGSAAGTLTIANPPDYFPSFQLYASSSTTNEMYVLNAATGTSVTRHFSTGSGPTDAALTADGRFLVVGNFRGNGVSIHSLVDDPAHGFTADQLVAHATFGTTVQRVVANPMRKRAYAASLDASTIGIIDVDPDSPAFGTAISTFSILTNSGVRSLAITSDGNYLFIGRAAAPHLLVADISTDTVTTTAGVTFASPASIGGRLDGLAVSPDGTRLYAMNSDPFMRIFDITSPMAPVQITTVSIPGGLSNDIHRIQVLPNNRFVYVAHRVKASLDVFDVALTAFVASIPTGVFSNDPAVAKNSNYVFLGVAETDMVLTIDARETINAAPNPKLHQIVASTGGGVGTTSVSVSGGISTSAGTNITIAPQPGVTVTFDEVTMPGLTSATSTNVSSGTLPPYFYNPGLPVFVSVESTAEFTGNVTTCLSYDGGSVTPVQESEARILYLVGSAYVDVTSSANAGTDTACGQTTGLGQFVVAFYDPSAPVISVPPSQTVISATPAQAFFAAATATDAHSGVASVSCNHASGETFPMGVTTVTCTAADNVGRTASASFTITVVPPNVAPVCTFASPSIASIWPPNHQMVNVTVNGVTDADGDATTITITSIYQDESVNSGGDGNTGVDGAGLNTSTAQVRAERSGNGNGRFYHIGFTATDPAGASCSGVVKVVVPHSQGKNKPPIDGGALFNSTLPPSGS
jgi:hypothetical protein